MLRLSLSIVLAGEHSFLMEIVVPGDNVNLDKMKSLSIIMELTGMELGYQREDGIHIMPIEQAFVACRRDTSDE